mgnify:CR=1 FL=1
MKKEIDDKNDEFQSTIAGFKAAIEELIYRKEKRHNEIGELGRYGSNFGERIQRSLIKHLGKQQAKKTTIKTINGEKK